MVEVVKMLVVAEQYGIDRANFTSRPGRAGRLFQDNTPRLITSWGIEGGICKHPHPGQFDEEGRTANKSKIYV
jgi:hypothetical protein